MSLSTVGVGELQDESWGFLFRVKLKFLTAQNSMDGTIRPLLSPDSFWLLYESSLSLYHRVWGLQLPQPELSMPRTFWQFAMPEDDSNILQAKMPRVNWG